MHSIGGLLEGSGPIVNVSNLAFLFLFQLLLQFSTLEPVGEEEEEGENGHDNVKTFVLGDSKNSQETDGATEVGTDHGRDYDPDVAPHKVAGDHEKEGGTAGKGPYVVGLREEIKGTVRHVTHESAE